MALAWIGIALAPYSFLTVFDANSQPPDVPGQRRPGDAVRIGDGALAGAGGFAPGVVAAVAAVALLHNVGYLWTRKRTQFLERAAPTEQLIALARRTPGPIWVRCFPRNHLIAEEAAHLGAGHPPADLIWDEAEAARRQVTAVFCYQEGRREK